MWATDRCRVVRKRKSSVKGVLDLNRRLFESLLSVFFKDGSVMLEGVFAALNHHGHQRFELTPCIARVVNVALSLSNFGQ